VAAGILPAEAARHSKPHSTGKMPVATFGEARLAGLE
jgi:hypothetical protein